MSELPDWPRPYFVPGGDDAFLLYLIFGDLPEEPAVSRSKYRFGGLPGGIEITRHDSGSGPEQDRFRRGPEWERLQRERPEVAAAIRPDTQVTTVRGAIADPATLNFFRDVVGLIQCLLDCGGVAVYDSLALKWWAPEEWREGAFESTTGAPQRHVTILSSPLEDGEWLHTRGMRKYGRPDLSVRRVAPELRSGVVELLRRFIDF